MYHQILHISQDIPIRNRSHRYSPTKKILLNECYLQSGTQESSSIIIERASRYYVEGCWIWKAIWKSSTNRCASIWDFGLRWFQDFSEHSGSFDRFYDNSGHTRVRDAYHSILRKLLTTRLEDSSHDCTIRTGFTHSFKDILVVGESSRQIWTRICQRR